MKAAFSFLGRVLPLIAVFAVTSAILGSCNLNTNNSFSTDQVCTGSLQYCNFVGIVKKDVHGCWFCHTNNGVNKDDWNAFQTIDDWVRAGLVTKGDASTSQILSIQKPLGDMPTDNFIPFDSNEIATITKYINSL